jgi:hypothetical protein
MRYNKINPQIKKYASEIVFGAAVLEGAPYTTYLELGDCEVFINVEAYRTVIGTTRYVVELSPDGYQSTKKNFGDTSNAVKFLATKLAELEGQAR